MHGGLVRADRNDPLGPLMQFPNGAFGVFNRSEDGAAALLQKPARSGQSTSAAIEQLFPQITFQPADRLAHRWLRSVQLCGCPGEAALRGDGEEDFQFPEVHGRETLLCCLGKLNVLVDVDYRSLSIAWIHSATRVRVISSFNGSGRGAWLIMPAFPSTRALISDGEHFLRRVHAYSRLGCRFVLDRRDRCSTLAARADDGGDAELRKPHAGQATACHDRVCENDRSGADRHEHDSRAGHARCASPL